MSGTSYLTGLVKHSRLPINRRSTFPGETGGVETVQSPQMGQASPVSQASDLRPKGPIETLAQSLHQLKTGHLIPPHQSPRRTCPA